MKSFSRSNFPNKPDTVVCERHFLGNFSEIIVNVKLRPDEIIVNVKLRPDETPSIFQSIPSSVKPTPLPKPKSI